MAKEMVAHTVGSSVATKMRKEQKKISKTYIARWNNKAIEQCVKYATICTKISGERIEVFSYSCIK